MSEQPPPPRQEFSNAQVVGWSVLIFILLLPVGFMLAIFSDGLGTDVTGTSFGLGPILMLSELALIPVGALILKKSQTVTGRSFGVSLIIATAVHFTTAGGLCIALWKGLSL